MGEKWTYLVLSDPDRNPTGLRIILEHVDQQRRALIQLTPAGEQVEVDDEPHDYECMEWKVVQIVDTARGTGSGSPVIEAVKGHLRAALGA